MNEKSYENGGPKTAVIVRKMLSHTQYNFPLLDHLDMYKRKGSFE